MKKGEHIYVYFRYEDFKYTHHGIYIGDKKVIHYWENQIICTSLDKFRCRKKIHIKKYKECYPAEAVVKRAKKRLKEKKYHLIFNNCEHFAYRCKTGKHRSKQVEEIPKRVVSEIDKILKQKITNTNKKLSKAKKTVSKYIKPTKIKLKKNKKPKLEMFKFKL